MGGVGSDSGQVEGGGIMPAVRVASKPAFAVVVAAAAFLAQDLFQRFSGVQFSVDEAVAFVTLASWFAYWLVPTSLQDQLPPAPPAPPAPTA